MEYSAFSVQVGFIIVWFLDFLQVFNQAKNDFSEVSDWVDIKH